MPILRLKSGNKQDPPFKVRNQVQMSGRMQVTTLHPTIPFPIKSAI